MGALVWSEEAKACARLELEQRLVAAEGVLRSGRAMIAGSQTPNIGFLLREYIGGTFAMTDHLYARLRETADNLAKAENVIPPDGSLFKFWSVDEAFISRFCGDLAPDVFPLLPAERLATTVILPAIDNEFKTIQLPKPINMVLQRSVRPEFRVFSTDDAIAYASPFSYQVLTRDLSAAWRSASPRTLSRSVIGRPRAFAADKPVVIIQDRFGQSNFSHFLFDGISRVLHYLKTFCGSPDSIFVFGGVPGKYQDMIIDALCEHAGIDKRNIFFPEQGILISSTAGFHWFSDQVETYLHPAQMAHPSSVALLRYLTDSIPLSASPSQRLYISRGDADRRRLVNEDDLVAILKPRGFDVIQLGKIPISEQMQLFRYANTVIGPHGMGLTHLAMCGRGTRVLELFPRHGASDAYAFFSLASGLDYRFLLGDVVPHSNSDFLVDINAVVAQLDEWRL